MTYENTTKRVVYNESVLSPKTSNVTQRNEITTGGNLSELDSLLNDLSNARYGSDVNRKCKYIESNSYNDKDFNSSILFLRSE